MAAVVELFTCFVDAAWSVGWQQFDEAGELVAEGRVSSTAASDRGATVRALYAMSLDLRLSRVRFEPTGRGILRVEATPSQIARATERQLAPITDGKRLRR
jgi:hypothetical protein